MEKTKLDIMKFPIKCAVILMAIMLFNYTYSLTYSLVQENGITKEVRLRVEGMTCRMCSLTISTALKKLDGVVATEVSYKKKEAKVFYEEGKVTVEQLVKAIKEVGKYKVRIIQDNNRTKGHDYDK
ncbi:MAG: cation transporter [Candidatus Dadabacteria bacterium]|nr:cation transporter [Candidatus Dadabacteria bacterium]